VRPEMTSILKNSVMVIIVVASVVAILLMKQGVLPVGPLILVLYLAIFLCIWLLLSTNLLVKEMNKLRQFPTENRADAFATLLHRTFLVDFFVNEKDLSDTYEQVVKQSQVSYKTKKKLYEVFDAKGIYVTYPMR
jgi:hypothetical protein